MAGFHLRKFITNSEELSCCIQLHESHSGDGEEGQPSSPVSRVAARDGGESLSHIEEDQSYTKTSLGVEVDEEQGVHKILGIEWNVNCDNFQFNIGGVATVMETSEPRGVLSVLQ